MSTHPLRAEDARLITGHGRYVANVHVPHTARLRVVGHPHAHARIRSVDTHVASGMAGVLTVWTSTTWRTGPCP